MLFDCVLYGWRVQIALAFAAQGVVYMGSIAANAPLAAASAIPPSGIHEDASPNCSLRSSFRGVSGAAVGTTPGSPLPPPSPISSHLSATVRATMSSSTATPTSQANTAGQPPAHVIDMAFTLASGGLVRARLAELCRAPAQVQSGSTLQTKGEAGLLGGGLASVSWDATSNCLYKASCETEEPSLIYGDVLKRI